MQCFCTLFSRHVAYSIIQSLSVAVDIAKVITGHNLEQARLNFLIKFLYQFNYTSECLPVTNDQNILRSIDRCSA